MKRIFYIILALFITANCTFAIEGLPFKKTEPQKKVIQTKEFANTSNQASIFYAENSIKESFNLLLSIPEEQRTAQNWLLLGNILQDEGRNNEAVFMFNKAAQTDENYYKAYYNLGNIYLEDDKPNMAIKEYQKVIKLQPNFPYAYYNLGCAYIKTGQIKKAKNSLLSAIELKNTEPDFHYNLAYVYKKLNNKKSADLYLKYYNQLIQNQ